MTTKFQLTATEGLEYDFNSGWVMADSTHKVSELFSTKEEAIAAKDAFVQSLKISEDEVFEIDLVTLIIDEDDKEIDEIETIELIDNSEKGYKYMLTQEFCQYQIAKNKYKIEYVGRNQLSRNQFLLRIENGSFRWNVMEVFKTEEEVRAYVTDDMNIIDSVVSGIIAEETED